MIIHGQENTKSSIVLNILKWSTRLTILWNLWKDDTWDAPLAFQDLPEEISITLLTPLNRNYSVFRNLVSFNCFIYLYIFCFYFQQRRKKDLGNFLPTWKRNYRNYVGNSQLPKWIRKVAGTSSFKFQLSFKFQRFISSFHLGITQKIMVMVRKNSTGLYSSFFAICPKKSI